MLVIHSLLCAVITCLVNAIVLPQPEPKAEPFLPGPEDVDPKNHSKIDLSLQRNNLIGRSGQGYHIELHIGTPPQKLRILIDTGSSNFAVAAYPSTLLTTYYHTNLSSTYEASDVKVSVPYTEGEWDGEVVSDKVTIDSLPNITFTPKLAAILNSVKFFTEGSDWQGILGLAYSPISRPDGTVTPFFDTLIESSHIPNLFALELCGLTHSATENTNGSMTIGGIDPELYTGDVWYTPIYREWYYEVTITDITVNEKSLALDCKEYNFDKTIVDSGTTNLRLPHTVFNALVARLKIEIEVDTPPEDAFWSGKDHLCWEKNVYIYSQFPTLTIILVRDTNSTFQLEILPQQYIKLVKPDESSATDKDCYKLAVQSSDTGTVLGAVVMEGYYVVFDREQKQIGFAESKCTSWDFFGLKPKISGPFKHEGNTTTCAYIKPKTDTSSFLIIAYIMAGLCVVCLIPLMIMSVHWCRYRCFRRGRPRPDDSNSSLVTD